MGLEFTQLFSVDDDPKQINKVKSHTLFRIKFSGINLGLYILLIIVIELTFSYAVLS